VDSVKAKEDRRISLSGSSVLPCLLIANIQISLS